MRRLTLLIYLRLTRQQGRKTGLTSDGSRIQWTLPHLRMDWWITAKEPAKSDPDRPAESSQSPTTDSSRSIQGACADEGGDSVRIQPSQSPLASGHKTTTLGGEETVSSQFYARRLGRREAHVRTWQSTSYAQNSPACGAEPRPKKAQVTRFSTRQLWIDI